MRFINKRLCTNIHMTNVNDHMPIVLFSLLKAIMYLVHILPEKGTYCNLGNFAFCIYENQRRKPAVPLISALFLLFTCR